MNRIIALSSFVGILALAACGDGGSPSSKPMTVRQQDTSKQAEPAKGSSGLTRRDESEVKETPAAKKP